MRQVSDLEFPTKTYEGGGRGQEAQIGVYLWYYSIIFIIRIISFLGLSITYFRYYQHSGCVLLHCISFDSLSLFVYLFLYLFF